MKHFMFIVFFAFACMAAQPLAAQKQPLNPKVVKQLETRIQDFAKAYTSIKNTHNKDSVLTFIDPGLRYSIFVFNIAGLSRTQQGTYKDFTNYLTYLSQSELESLRYDVENVTVTHADDYTGTLVYSVHYETHEKDGLWVNGNETVSMALGKREGVWKILHYSVMQVEDEKLKGTCLCELYKSSGKGGEVVAKTTIPVGQAYATKFNNFDFQSTDDGETIIYTGDYVFSRNTEGTLVTFNEGEVVEIAKGVKTQKEALAFILRDYLYKESCSKLRMR